MQPKWQDFAQDAGEPTHPVDEAVTQDMAIQMPQPIARSGILIDVGGRPTGLLRALLQAPLVGAVDDVHERVRRLEVVAPIGADRLLAADVLAERTCLTEAGPCRAYMLAYPACMHACMDLLRCANNMCREACSACQPAQSMTTWRGHAQNSMAALPIPSSPPPAHVAQPSLLTCLLIACTEALRRIP